MFLYACATTTFLICQIIHTNIRWKCSAENGKRNYILNLNDNIAALPFADHLYSVCV